MTSPLLSSNPAVIPNQSSTRRRKKKKIQNQISGENQINDQNSSIEWKSDAQQQIYSSKLIQALRQVRQTGGAGPKRVHEAADRVLAATARGRTRWSRAILTNRLKLKFMKKNNIVKRQNRVMTVITSGRDRLKRKSKVTISRLKSKSLPTVQRKARVLGKLVPGCRKEPLPVVLEEATDYIAALEMQVRAMSALAQLLSISGPSSSTNSVAASASGGGSNLFGSSSGSTSGGGSNLFGSVSGGGFNLFGSGSGSTSGGGSNLFGSTSSGGSSMLGSGSNSTSGSGSNLFGSGSCSRRSHPT